ncbi:MAG: GNAT family N-acetyltransferase [Candidatus Gracilibacteria bacterium]
MKISITYATLKDLEYLKKNDIHIDIKRLEKKISDKELIIAKDNMKHIGWLRFGYIWDTIPFMSMLAIEDEYQKKGIGTNLTKFWEREMKKCKHKLVMTSSQADEEAQHFYRKLGYHDMGALFEINDGPAEIFFSKKLRNGA